MHGDNSGYYQACSRLATIYRSLGESQRAKHWWDFAEGLKRRMNELCWNGSFYTHFVKETPVTIDGVDEASQLSFSNPMNINRGVCSTEQAISILQEYRDRKASTQAFAEWFSIEPPFPDGIFGDEKIVGGAYCNGGIMPLVGGELARAYLENGFEREGIETLQTYHKLISKNNETFLWYFPDGTESSIDTSTSPDATPTDGWGSSSMLYGLVEGLVGVQDHEKQFEKVSLCPRWAAADIAEAEASVGYEQSDASIRYQYRQTDNGIQLAIEAKRSSVAFKQLLPQDAQVARVSCGGADVDFQESKARASRYVHFQADIEKGADVTIHFK